MVRRVASARAAVVAIGGVTALGAAVAIGLGSSAGASANPAPPRSTVPDQSSRQPPAGDDAPKNHVPKERTAKHKTHTRVRHQAPQKLVTPSQGPSQAQSSGS